MASFRLALSRAILLQPNYYQNICFDTSVPYLHIWDGVQLPFYLTDKGGQLDKEPNPWLVKIWMFQFQVYIDSQRSCPGIGTCQS